MKLIDIIKRDVYGLNTDEYTIAPYTDERIVTVLNEAGTEISQITGVKYSFTTESEEDQYSNALKKALKLYMQFDICMNDVHENAKGAKISDGVNTDDTKQMGESQIATCFLIKSEFEKYISKVLSGEGEAPIQTINAYIY